MDVDKRVKLVIGDLVVQNQALMAELEQLQARIKELEPTKQPREPE